MTERIISSQWLSYSSALVQQQRISLDESNLCLEYMQKVNNCELLEVPCLYFSHVNRALAMMSKLLMITYQKYYCVYVLIFQDSTNNHPYNIVTI